MAHTAREETAPPAPPADVIDLLADMAEDDEVAAPTRTRSRRAEPVRVFVGESASTRDAPTRGSA